MNCWKEPRFSWNICFLRVSAGWSQGNLPGDERLEDFITIWEVKMREIWGDGLHDVDRILIHTDMGLHFDL